MDKFNKIILPIQTGFENHAQDFHLQQHSDQCNGELIL